jgi:phage gp36-like protein
MAYTTAADIQKYFNGLAYVDSEGTDNNISEANVDQFIDEQSSIIDLTLSKKYTLPISDATDLNYLKIVCDKLVVCQIDKIMRTFAMDDEAQFMRRRNYCKEAQEMLDKLMSGEISLSATQKSFSALKYNKKTVYDNDCECRQNEVDCE